MQRRHFLKTSLLTSGLAWMTRYGAATVAGTPDELRVGLVGAGRQGRILLSAAVAIPGIRIAAVCDIWPYAQNYAEKYLARYGMKAAVYSDYRRMLDGQTALDAVLIATPDFVHADQANAFLQSGTHVYCEPMLAHDLSAGRSILKIAKETGKLLQVGYQRRSNPVYRHVLSKLLDDAELVGEMTNVQTQWATPVQQPRGWPRRYEIPGADLRRHGYGSMTEFRNWVWYPKYSGGPYCNFVAPQLDVCRWFLGAAPTSVLATGDASFYPDLPGLDTVMAIYEIPAETTRKIMVGSSMLTNTSAGGERRFERFLGTEGSVQVSDNARWIEVCREADAPSWDAWLRKKYVVQPKKKALPVGSAMNEVRVSGEVEKYELPAIQQLPECQAHLANFFASVRGQQQLNCTGRDAWPSHVAAWRTLEAVKTRKTLALDAAAYRV